jgi:anti-sigma regulatory factor (Ser/Thr protein kinase)
MRDHVVLFFEDEDELVQAVHAYLAEGCRNGGASVLIATEAHGRAFNQALPSDARGTGPIRCLDAAETLSQIMVGGHPAPDRFDAVVGCTIRTLARSGRPLRAFGEMVSLLWQAGNVTGALELERLWEELGQRVGFSLFCAYPDQASAATEHIDARRQVLRLHTGVVPSPRRFVVESSYSSDPDSPGAARRFVTAYLRGRGWDEGLIDAAALAVTELATNAIVHAHSPFTVTLTADGNGVRVEVRDADPIPPLDQRRDRLAEGGRGLCLVRGVARRWGSAPEATGKVVWVELAE